MTCDNKSQTHNPEVIGEDLNAILVFCPQCNKQARIGKDTQGNPEHRLYGEWFKRDVLQPDTPLWSKYAGAKFMNVV